MLTSASLYQRSFFFVLFANYGAHKNENMTTQQNQAQQNRVYIQWYILYIIYRAFWEMIPPLRLYQRGWQWPILPSSFDTDLWLQTNLSQSCC